MPRRSGAGATAAGYKIIRPSSVSVWQACMYILRLGSDEFMLLQCCCYILLFVFFCELFCCLYCCGSTVSNDWYEW